MGDDNIFIFGLKTPEVLALREVGYHPLRYFEQNAKLRAVINAISEGVFSPNEPHRYRGLMDSLLGGGDHYMLLADYESYVNTQEKVDALYQTPSQWAERAITNVAGMGIFSADRTIGEYAKTIWNVASLNEH